MSFLFSCSLIHHLILLSLSHFHRILPSHPLFPRLQPSQDPSLSLAHPNREASPLIRFRCPCITFLSHHQLSILPCIVWDYCQCTPSRSLPHRGPSMAQCSTLHLAVPPAILAWMIPASSLHSLLPDRWQSLTLLMMDIGLVLWLQIPWWTMVQWVIRVIFLLSSFIYGCGKVK